MRWPWSRRRDPGAQDAINDAQKRLDAASAAEPAVSRAVRELRRIQAENNYAAQLMAAFREHR